MVYRDCCVALSHGAAGLSALCDCSNFPDHTYVLFLLYNVLENPVDHAKFTRWYLMEFNRIIVIQIETRK